MGATEPYADGVDPTDGLEPFGQPADGVKSETEEAEAETSEEELEEDETPETKTDTDERDPEWKGVPDKVYARIKEKVDEVNSLKAENTELSSYRQDAETLRGLLSDPDKARELAKIVFGTGAAKTEPEPEVSLKDFEIKDGMTDGDIAESIANVAEKRVLSGLGNRMTGMEQKVDMLLGHFKEQTVSKLVTDKESFPEADKVKADIEKAMDQYGIPEDKAYYFVMGPRLKEIGFQRGLKAKEQKVKTDVIPHSTTKKTVVATGKVKNYKEALKRTFEKMGLTEADFDV